MYMACPSMYTHVHVHVPHIQKLWEFPSKKICASSLFIHIQKLNIFQWSLLKDCKPTLLVKTIQIKK